MSDMQRVRFTDAINHLLLYVATARFILMPNKSLLQTTSVASAPQASAEFNRQAHGAQVWTSMY